MPSLVDPVDVVEGVTAPSRVLFGPHVTNLGDRRALSDRHVAYYRERAAGGTGILVTETASVHRDDHPYERAPLAADCAPGWSKTATACRPFGTVVLAGLGHSGSQGTSAYSQTVLWAPSRVADPASRELPAEMEQEQIDDVVTGFAAAAASAMRSGLAGIEIDAGPRSLLRQFLSGLTNRRSDVYGTDRLLIVRQVVTAVRAAVGAAIVALRLSCDELASWGGITPDAALDLVAAFAPKVDLLIVVRGGSFSTAAYRPDAHTVPTFNCELTRRMRGAAAGRTLVVLQGSVVDVEAAEQALGDGTADLVEMTRRQIAEPRLVELVRAGTPEQARPCILCNQACQVLDPTNVAVSCVGEPRSGHETTDRSVAGRDREPHRVLVVGGGPAGLEAARVLASRGHEVRLHERRGALGGAAARAAAGPGRDRLTLLPDWLAAEVVRLGVHVRVDSEITALALDGAVAGGTEVILATGSRAAPRAGALDVLDVLTGGPDTVPPGVVVFVDPVGGPIAVGAAEGLAAAGRSCTLVTPDPVVGSRLARTGDLVAANGRLARAGVRRETSAAIREVRAGVAVLEDVGTGGRRSVPGDVLVDCGHRLPDDELSRCRPDLATAGDAVAPRSILEAVSEGRRRALEIGVAPPAHRLVRAG